MKSELRNVVDPAEEVTVYCGSGVTAAPLYAMLKHNGYENVRLYVGSYSDWISDEKARSRERIKTRFGEKGYIPFMNGHLKEGL